MWASNTRKREVGGNLSFERAILNLLSIHRVMNKDKICTLNNSCVTSRMIVLKNTERIGMAYITMKRRNIYMMLKMITVARMVKRILMMCILVEMGLMLQVVTNRTMCIIFLKTSGHIQMAINQNLTICKVK